MPLSHLYNWDRMSSLPVRSFIAAALAWLALGANAHAAGKMATRVKAPAPEKKVLTTTVFYERPTLELDIKPDSNEGTKPIQLRPNSPYSLGAGLAWGDYAFSIALPVSQSEDEMRRKGETRYLHLHLTRDWSSSGVDFSFAQFKGFYVEGQQSKDDPSGDSHLKRPDVFARQVGMNYYKVISPERYYLRPERDGAKYGRGFQWSWLLTAGASHLDVEGGAGLMDEKFRKENNSTQIRSGHFTTAVGGAGWGWQNLFTKTGNLGGKILIGYGPQHQQFETHSETVNHTGISSKIAFTMGGSFAIGWVKLGMDYYSELTNVNVGSTELKSWARSTVFYAKRDF